MRVILNAVRLMTLASCAEVRVRLGLDGVGDDAGAADADVDDAVGLADAVKRAGHERVVLDRIAKHDQLRAADAVAIGRAFGGRHDDFAHARHGVHVDARARRGDVDRRADALGARERFG